MKNTISANLILVEIYVPFNDVTQQSLVHALKESGITEYSDEQIQSIMGDYNTLPWYALSTQEVVISL